MTDGRRERDRAPLARHAAHRRPAAAPGARLRHGRRRPASIDRGIADEALLAARGRRARPRRDGPALSDDDRRCITAAARSASRRSRRRSSEPRDAIEEIDRALPHPAGLRAAHAARPHADRRMASRISASAAAQARRAQFELLAVRGRCRETRPTLPSPAVRHAATAAFASGPRLLRGHRLPAASSITPTTCASPSAARTELLRAARRQPARADADERATARLRGAPLRGRFPPPARLDDELEVETAEDIARRALSLLEQVDRGGERPVDATRDGGLVDGQGRPCRMPDALASAADAAALRIADHAPL